MLTSWKESYDQPRQHNKKQRHYFANKGLSSQSYGFSCSRIQMRELDHKECWALKNWCFRIVVLEKTLESPRTARRSNQSILKEISPSNEYSGLISVRIDWFDLLVVQGTLKSLQHHSSKASVLQCSAFFIVQLSHPYMTTGKTIAFTRQISTSTYFYIYIFIH